MILVPKKILIVGSQETGIVLAARLQMSGFQTLVVGRGQGRVVRFEGWGQTVSCPVYGLNQSSFNSVGLAIITVKAYDLLGVIQRYAPYFPTNIPIVLICRGAIGEIIKTACSQFDTFLWRRGVSNFSTRVLNRNYVILDHSGTSRLALGAPSSQLAALKGRGLTPFEEHIIEANQGCFRWCSDMTPIVRRRWLEDTVIDSLCVVLGLKEQGELLHHLEVLKEVFHEAYHLGAEHWGQWKTCEDQLYIELVSTITQSSARKNPMAASLASGFRTESAWLANIASFYRGYPKLKSLYKQIQDLEKKYSTSERKRS